MPLDLRVPLPGLVWGAYPERREPPRSSWPWQRAPYRRQLAAVRAALGAWRGLDEAAFGARLRGVQGRLGREGLVGEGLIEALAAVAEAARRSLGLAAYDTQLHAALAMLDRRLAEMATGEGKTLSAALAAAVGALAGMPVHVLTANDYLVERDATRLAPFYARLGLRVDFVVGGMGEARRRAAYGASVCYVTARELVFDYLRDGQRRGFARSDLQRRVAAIGGAEGLEPLLRGLCMAVVDEADSLLIDEAMMPLILSRQVRDGGARAFFWQAWSLAGELLPGVDFRVDAPAMQVHLTDAGRARLAARAAALGGRWRSARLRDEAVGLALVARHVYRRDVHYLVRDGQVEIVDEITGRAAPGRVWSRGLHGLVELKEGCRPSPATETLAQITFQRFFPRYHWLCGMSGTLREARGELREIYGLDVVCIPSRRPSSRKSLPSRLYRARHALWDAVARRIVEIRRTGRPVLVGTASVADSESLSARLTAAGVAHAVLNARFDAEEAAIVARAGEPGQVTVATNMAGRGTDIPLAAGVAAAGGLHVMCCQFNASRRIDRQLEGRCARQGDPGSVETWISLDMARVAEVPLLGLLARRHGVAPDGTVRLRPQWLRPLLSAHQWRRARQERRARRGLLEADREWERGLSFGGPGE
ncbi:preprotein translocase subunit SecA [Zoogloea sp.]|uniref:preprotein translocase subunit SecA n=1 Tax=Zoogloea sp. TaxID=49181 RepID=UPI0035B19B4A